MYETEANYKIESLDQIPADVVMALGELSGKVAARTVLPWAEHCTECVWPSCYSTCELYSPRADGRCRRFTDGMVRVNCPTALNSYLLKVRFKRWGKLWTPGNTRLLPLSKAQQLERRDFWIGTALYQLPLPNQIKKKVTGKRYNFKKERAREAMAGENSPTCFLVECFNPGDAVIRVSLTMKSFNSDLVVPFQELLEFAPGFHRVRIPYEKIVQVLDLRSPFHIELAPNDVVDGTALFFGTLDFVQELGEPSRKSKAIKCVVWDLDNTLWDGILVEDGLQQLRLKTGIVEVIQELDQRGILHSVSSKNNPDDGLEALKHFHLAEYFLCPQISWQPKSEGIKAIARQLNIGMDSLLFVDDSEFELQQVKTVLPEVQLLNAREYQNLSQMPVCNVPVMAESAERRKMYLLEEKRQVVAGGFGQDYMAFLKDCNIRLHIRPLTEQNLERVHELTQRTNQMNFSGNPYNRDLLRMILSTSHLDTYVLECADRFGSYGIIGFSIVDRREPRMTDLMFSCRIQSKRVEHAFLNCIIRKYITESDKGFHANYRKTPRNASSGRVFEDLGMKVEGIHDGVFSLVFHKHQEIPDDRVMEVVFLQEPSRSRIA
jgi:FkbH-like protein